MDTASSGVYLSKRWKLSEMRNHTFFNKTDLQKSVSMYPVLRIETPHGVLWDAKLGTWKQRGSN